MLSRSCLRVAPTPIFMAPTVEVSVRFEGYGRNAGVVRDERFSAMPSPADRKMPIIDAGLNVIGKVKLMMLEPATTATGPAVRISQ